MNYICYIGSTIQSLEKRFSEHKSDSKREKCKNKILYKLFKKYGIDNFEIKLINEYNCTKSQLRSYEQFHIEKYNSCNANRAIGLDKQKINEYKKKYYENNREKIKEYKKKYYENNREKVKEYYENNREKVKEYYENNREKIKEYYENNREKIKEYRQNNKDKIICICGSKVRLGAKQRHLKTCKHNDFVQIINLYSNPFNYMN